MAAASNPFSIDITKEHCFTFMNGYLRLSDININYILRDIISLIINFWHAVVEWEVDIKTLLQNPTNKNKTDWNIIRGPLFSIYDITFQCILKIKQNCIRFGIEPFIFPPYHISTTFCYITLNCKEIQYEWKTVHHFKSFYYRYRHSPPKSNLRAFLELNKNDIIQYKKLHFGYYFQINRSNCKYIIHRNHSFGTSHWTSNGKYYFYSPNYEIPMSRNKIIHYEWFVDESILQNILKKREFGKVYFSSNFGSNCWCLYLSKSRRTGSIQLGLKLIYLPIEYSTIRIQCTFKCPKRLNDKNNNILTSDAATIYDGYYRDIRWKRMCGISEILYWHNNNRNVSFSVDINVINLNHIGNDSVKRFKEGAVCYN